MRKLPKIIFSISFGLVFYLFSYCDGIPNEIKGLNDKGSFLVKIKRGVVSIKFGEGSIEFPLVGYDANNVIVKDFNNDHNDEIIFLDLGGVSVGGRVRLITWEHDRPVEIKVDRVANRLSFIDYHDSTYLILEQHVTKNLFYVGDVLSFDGKKLGHNTNIDLWDRVIKQKLLSKVPNLKSLEDKSLIYSFAYLAYKKINRNALAMEYFNKAKEIFPDNPYLK